jgi:hypothetical protein
MRFLQALLKLKIIRASNLVRCGIGTSLAYYVRGKMAALGERDLPVGEESSGSQIRFGRHDPDSAPPLPSSFGPPLFLPFRFPTSKVEALTKLQILTPPRLGSSGAVQAA